MYWQGRATGASLEGLKATKRCQRHFFFFGLLSPSISNRRARMTPLSLREGRLEALAVDDARARLVVFVLGDPHLLERRERREDGAANPDGVLSLGRRHNLDLDRRRREGGELLVETLVDAGEHGRAAGQDGVGVEVTANVNIALLDRIVGQLVDAGRLLPDEAWREHRFAAADPC